jgi:hypothetical protein
MAGKTLKGKKPREVQAVAAAKGEELGSCWLAVWRW